jgi:hypothetical protein
MNTRWGGGGRGVKRDMNQSLLVIIYKCAKVTSRFAAAHMVHSDSLVGPVNESVREMWSVRRLKKTIEKKMQTYARNCTVISMQQ